MKRVRSIRSLLVLQLALCLVAADGGAIVVDRAVIGLLRAIRANDIQRVQQELDDSGQALVHRNLFAGVTPLHVAAAANAQAIVDLLAAQGADIDARTEQGFTPLHWAAAKDAVQAAERLLHHGADLLQTTATGITPLHWAANNNATNIVNLLLAVGADVLPETSTGQTPLHWAVLKQSEAAAEMLAFQAVTQEMADESHAVDVAILAAPPPTDTPDADRLDAPLPPPDVGVPVDHLPRPAFGRKLIVPLGFGEQLTFIWIGRLGMWIGEHEVTNGQFRRFRPKHKSMFHEGFSLNGNSQPVVYVSWHDAMELCRWLNRQYADRIPRGCEFRLPTDREWHTVAQCGDDRIYPWGNEWPPAYGNFSDLTARKSFTLWEGIRHYEDGYAVSAPVFHSGVNEWGVYGLAGNVWEWCSDWYNADKTYKIRRGGSWDFDGEVSLRIATRGFDRPDARYDTIGIRLAVGRTGTPIVTHGE